MKRLFLILFLCSYAACSGSEPWVEPIAMKCSFTVTFETGLSHESVELLSLSESQAVLRSPMSYDADLNEWSIVLDRAQTQRYLISVDNNLSTDIHNPLSIQVDGQRWSYLSAQECNRPRFAFVQREQSAERTFLTLQLERVDKDSGLNPDTIIAEVNNQRVAVQSIGDQVLVDITSQSHGKHVLKLTAADEEQRVTQPFEQTFWIEQSPFQWSEALLYQVVTDRFAGFENAVPAEWTIGRYRGGGWTGIKNKIEAGYFESMGVNALWISPINENPSGLWTGVEGGAPKYEGYHGYWRTSNSRINTEFGSENELKSLIDMAHSNGIRVILDVVLNHRHQDFEEFSGGLIRGNSACICGRSICPWWSDIERCWFTSYLPDIDYNYAQSVHQEIAALTALLQQYDFDGLRVDAVPMMPRFVIRHLKAHMKTNFEGLDNKFILLGETFTNEDGHDHIRYYLGQHGLDGQFDFPFMWALRNVFAHGLGSSEDLIDAWRTSERAWRGSQSTMALMIGNHDVPRFTSVAAHQDVFNPWSHPPPQVTASDVLERTLMAQAIVLALPGIATLYYGDELGLSGGQDPDNRRPYPPLSEQAASQHLLQSQMQRLGRTRQCLIKSLTKDVDLTSLSPSHIALIRHDLRTQRPRLIVVTDRDKTGQSIVLSNRTHDLTPAQEWVDILSGEQFTSSANTMNIAASSGGTRWLLLTPDPCANLGEW